uniref:DUF29 domain-containing protein n=1 Tax=Desulfatirhabdium butyrativorans TaxID=340467 RepID=A0A7C4VZK8_9BACT
MNTLYEKDFYLWTVEQANLLRTGALSQLDIKNLLEEIEAMGRSEKRELRSRLTVLIMNLLKWDYQPEFRCKSWESTIQTQRKEIEFVLNDNPSLRQGLSDVILQAYPLSRLKASLETGMSESTFPESCPYTIEQILGE